MYKYKWINKDRCMSDMPYTNIFSLHYIKDQTISKWAKNITAILYRLIEHLKLTIYLALFD